MKALVYHEFGGPLAIERVADPRPAPDGAVIELRATGLCRSDWHGWMGHDPDIRQLPHVPGHELAGVVAEVGSEVAGWKVGQRVTMPFVAGCGRCPECRRGAAQVCDHQFQPGFTGWGALAEAVAVRYADFNLISLPEQLDDVTAASLGCRVATAYRAVVQQGGVAAGQSVAVHGCGGLGLAAIMIAAALGARVIGVDIQSDALRIAKALGADATINAREVDVATAIQSLTGGGADVSLDALGSAVTAVGSLQCLRKGGRHVQVGLLAGDDATPKVPLELVVARELQLVGSHGLAAVDYSGLMALILDGRIDPTSLIQQRIDLSNAPDALQRMGSFAGLGITVVDQF